MRNAIRSLVMGAFVGMMALSAGCGGKKGKCEKAFDHALDLAKKEADKAGAEGGEMMKAMLEGMKKAKGEAIEKCVKESTDAELDCAIKASDMEALQKCNSEKK